MYKNIFQIMEERGISEVQIERELSLNGKFANGERELSFSDALKIQKRYFKEYSLTYLFENKKRS